MSFQMARSCDPSTAEIQLLCALMEDEELRPYIFFHEPIMLGVKNGRAWGTVPDYKYINHEENCRLAVYLDGPHHLKPRCQKRDEEIDFRLKLEGWRLHRIPYNGKKLSRSKTKRFVKEIKEAVK